MTQEGKPIRGRWIGRILFLGYAPVEDVGIAVHVRAGAHAWMVLLLWPKFSHTKDAPPQVDASAQNVWRFGK